MRNQTGRMSQGNSTLPEGMDSTLEIKECLGDLVPCVCVRTGGCWPHLGKELPSVKIFQTELKSLESAREALKSTCRMGNEQVCIHIKIRNHSVCVCVCVCVCV